MNSQKQSRRIALGGVFASLAVVCMLMGSVLPFSTYLAPALGGALLLPLAMEMGIGAGFLAFAAIAVLSMLMVPDKEMALMFVCLLGYYPILKLKLDGLHSKVVQWCMKFALCNISVCGMYAVILFLFPIAAVVAEFGEMSNVFIALLLLMGNVTFFLYDIALSRFAGLYLNVLRPKLLR